MREALKWFERRLEWILVDMGLVLTTGSIYLGLVQEGWLHTQVFDCGIAVGLLLFFTGGLLLGRKLFSRQLVTTVVLIAGLLIMADSIRVAWTAALTNVYSLQLLITGPALLAAGWWLAGNKLERVDYLWFTVLMWTGAGILKGFGMEPIPVAIKVFRTAQVLLIWACAFSKAFWQRTCGGEQ